MRRNIVKKKLLSGEMVFGTMLHNVTTPAMAQIIKEIGFDFFMIDAEHGPYTINDIAGLVRVGRILDMCPMVRIASPEYHLISQPLDQGAMGLMLPRVATRADVEKFVDSMKYPPVGSRGCSTGAPHGEYQSCPMAEFVEINNEDTLAIAQIERVEAVENIDQILSVPGVDAAVIGPTDLSVSLGIPGQTDHPKIVKAIEHVIEAANRHNVVPGVHMGRVESLQAWMAKGMRLIMYGSDTVFFKDAAAKLAQLREKM